MNQEKEIKTFKSITKLNNQIYRSIFKNYDRTYKLIIKCYSQDNIEFKYYFEINKNGIPIYKRGLNTNKYITVHSEIYKIIKFYFDKGLYSFSCINESTEKGICRIYFNNNFNIEIKYNNITDKLFFENMFINIKIEKEKLLKVEI